MAKIAVNTRLLLSGRLEGISRFAWEVLKRMTRDHPEHEFIFLFDRAFDPSFIPADNVSPLIVRPQARHPVLWYAWFHLQLGRLLPKLKADVFFSPEFYLCLSADIPQLPVFHDLAYEHYPKDNRPLISRYFRYYSPRFARKASHILTVSEFSKQDIISHYQIEAEKISVVYNGASDQFLPISESDQQKVRDQYSQGCPYFHFVGTVHPRKNLENLLRAFDLFKSQTESPVKLLLVGRKGWKYQGIMKVYEQMQFQSEVLFTGFVPDEDLGRIYGASLGLVYVPYLEGFGIPLLEAMHGETAIICSDRTSMPEVAGPAAIQVDPFSPEAISKAMAQIYQDPVLRQGLVEAGKHQRTRFSWDLTYQKVWQALEKLL